MVVVVVGFKIENNFSTVRFFERNEVHSSRREMSLNVGVAVVVVVVVNDDPDVADVDVASRERRRFDYIYIHEVDTGDRLSRMLITLTTAIKPFPQLNLSPI